MTPTGMSFEHFCDFVGDDNQPIAAGAASRHPYDSPMADGTRRFLFSPMPDLHSPGGLENLA
jgi:hypothetical protein